MSSRFGSIFTNIKRALRSIPVPVRKITGPPLLGAALGLAVFPIVLIGVGLAGGGVVAGTAAAAWQASIGNVAAGSFFAGLQSISMTGLAPAIGAGIGAAVGLLGAGVKELSRFW
ncbi:hypothetical protein AA313_de0210308 [Arthrobotrys entomopaga]|nr:hypothetical protein AA313_de0210308 [Arthrobotrys entomopaga]